MRSCPINGILLLMGTMFLLLLLNPMTSSVSGARDLDVPLYRGKGSYQDQQQQLHSEEGVHSELETWTIEFDFDHGDIRHSTTGDGESTWGHFTCLGPSCKHWLLPTTAICTAEQHRSIDALADLHPRVYGRELKLGLSNILQWQCSFSSPDNVEDHFGYAVTRVQCPTHPLEKAASAILSVNPLLSPSASLSKESPVDITSTKSKRHFTKRSDGGRGKKGRRSYEYDDDEEDDIPPSPRGAVEGDDRKWVRFVSSSTEYDGQHTLKEEDLAWMYDCHLSFRVENHGPLHMKVSLVILLLALVTFLVTMFCYVGSKDYNHEVARSRMGKHFDRFEIERAQAQKDRARYPQQQEDSRLKQQQQYQQRSTADDYQYDTNTAFPSSTAGSSQGGTKLEMLNVDGPRTPDYSAAVDTTRRRRGGATNSSQRHQTAAPSAAQDRRGVQFRGDPPPARRNQQYRAGGDEIGSMSYLHSLDIGGVEQMDDPASGPPRQQQQPQRNPTQPLRQPQHPQQSDFGAVGVGGGLNYEGVPSHHHPPISSLGGASSMKDRIRQAQATKDGGRGIPIVMGGQASHLGGGGAGPPPGPFAFENPQGLSLGELRRMQREGAPPPLGGGGVFPPPAGGGSFRRGSSGPGQYEMPSGMGGGAQHHDLNADPRTGRNEDYRPPTAQEQAVMRSRLPPTLGNTFGIDGPM